MAELRYNPLLGDWTIVASHRQNRPNMPKEWCPFCPGSGKVPDDYEVYAYDNDFPALMISPPEPDLAGSELYKVEKAYGKCEVILYSPNHTATLPELSVPHITKLIELWTERFRVLSEDPKHKYILIFENRGEECGVTMPHPHGQIYAYSWIPLKIRTELANCHHHYEMKGTCLICDLHQEELAFQKRIIMENEHFTAFLPFFTDFPYGLFIVSKCHKSSLLDFSKEEKRSLAVMLKHMTGAMDTLYHRTFPYMMVLHQRPVHDFDAETFYHFHIEFYPPLRDAHKIKYYASSEMGAWAATNTQAVEQSAENLRQAYVRYLSSLDSEKED